MQLRHNWEEIGDLLSDDGTQVSQANQLTNPTLLELLNDAQAEVVGALLVGGRYSIADFDDFTGPNLALLKTHICRVCKMRLVERRPGRFADTLEAMQKIVDGYLKQFRSGDVIFNLPAVIAAGAATVAGPSTLELENLNLVRDQTRNYYPRRNLPGNR
jgi:phage gp36-like protein